MKKFYWIVLIVAFFLLMNSKEGMAAGSALYQGPLDTFKNLDNQISVLSSGDFNNIQTAARQKETLLQQIHELIPKVENGAYQSAINTLDHEIRNNIQKWIVTGQQTKLLECVDNAIVSVDNANQSTITTVYGKVAGAEAGFDCWAWKGIPFAKPPVGNLRWRAPQDLESWSKIRQYSQSYTRCTQAPLSKEWLPLKTVSGSEDCLYLDIYAPKYLKGKLPVYFWIHGGGNFVGGADELTWCSSLARFSHVIVVVIQYRLGPFGFFTHPALNPGGSPEDKSGNYAVLDQIKALKWVQRNIEYFGGDPGNVMIAGESAGGLNTLNLMISPLAKGLFHKALVQSAGGKNIPVTSGVVQANAIIDKLLVADGTCKNLSRAADFRASMPPFKIESYLRKKTGEQILQAMLFADGRTESINPFIDKVVIPGRLESVFKSGNYNKVPVIIGNNADEVKPFMPQYLGSVPTSSGYSWYNVFNVIGSAQPSMTLDQLMPPGSDDQTIYQNCAKYASLSWKATRVDGLARLMKQHQDNVYCYWFKWGGPGSGPPPVDFLIGAGHAFDIPFFFGFDVCVWGISATEANREGRKALTESIMSYVASFIATGNPNRENGGLPVWEGWSNSPGGPKSIIFDADFTQAKISMMNQEIKEEEVMAQIYAIPSKWERDLIMELLWNDMGHDLDLKL